MAIDRNSASAMYLREILEAQIEKKRRSVERTSYDHDKTQVIRGELLALRWLYKEVSLTPTEESDENESD